MSRCWLLTDGLANVGFTDTEQIAAQAADIRRNAGISTSTFGVGTDYDETLLGPMAVAGGGQFHHLRTETEIAATFSGELAELFRVAARGVRLEIELDRGTKAEVISPYWSVASDDGQRLRIDIGDLLPDEERRVVVRLGFDKVPEGALVPVRARVFFRGESGEIEGDAAALSFEGASDARCDAEARDAAVMHWVGLHHADRARIEALRLCRDGDERGALSVLDRVIRRLAEYATGDQELVSALERLRDLHREIKERRLSAAVAHETYYQSQTRSRGQRDHRGGSA